MGIPKNLSARLFAVSLFLTSIMSLAPCQQDWRPFSPRQTTADLRPGPGEVSVEVALKECVAFLGKIGHKKPKVVPAVMKSKSSNLYHFSYGSNCSISVKSDSGRVFAFRFSQRELDMDKGRRSKLPSRYPTLLSTQLRFHALAKKLGIPSSHKLTRNEITGGGDPRTTENPGRRCAVGRFAYMPYGYPVEFGWNDYGLQFDVTDGALVYYSAPGNRTYRFETKSPKLTLEQAKEKAAPIAKRTGAGLVESPAARMAWGTNPKPPKVRNRLAFVCPNGKMGGVKYDLAQNPQRVRLAWVFYYAVGDAIWIDATDGRLLGGSTHREKQ